MTDTRLTKDSAARRLSIAPMMDWTDRHDRYFLRLISRECLLFTEMVTSGAVIHGDRGKLLDFDASEHPLACQLGGSDPKDLAEAARIVESWGYDEVNLNVGCPSDRVQNGKFGACLMAEPDLVARCVEAMRDAVSIPVTVKNRIGIDDDDSYEAFSNFIRIVRDGGCEIFTIHARKAILQGLSPKENRTIPPLRYDYAYDIKKDFPDLHITINGGIMDMDQSLDHLAHVDGVMIGRAAYQTPYILAEADQRIFGKTEHPVKSRKAIVEEFLPYLEARVAQGWRLGNITRHIIGLFNGLPGSRQWRRHISENAHKPGANIEVVQQALDMVPDETMVNEPA